MPSDWCKGVGYSPAHKEFGLLAKDRKGLALFSMGFEGSMMEDSARVRMRNLLFEKPPYTPTILPINLCKWETEE